MSKLPDTWQEVKLKDIATFSQGLQVGVEEQVSTPIDNYVRFIRIVDYTQKNEDIRFVENKGQRYFASKSDIVMVRYGTPGLVGRGIEGIIANNLFKINLDQKIANNDFFEHLLKSSFVQNKLQSGSASTTMPAINFSTLNTVVIPLPPLEEQKKIADILSTVDKKIAFVEENINATEELKKGLMQKLLTEGIGHTEFKDSELGRIPESWEVKSIGSLTSLTAGGTPSTQIKDYWNPKEIPWLSSGEVNKKIIYFTDNMISKQGLNNSAAKFIPKYSVLIALAGQGKTRGTVAISEIELTTNQSVASILPSEKLDMYFIYYNLDSRYEEIRSMSTGVGGRGGLNLAILKSIKIALPPQKEQKQIAEILSTVDNKLENLKEKKQSFEELKKGLMQKLLTGKVRV